jgi:medium-chain acyl-[acyl-carrier-protein] hydrolase
MIARTGYRNPWLSCLRPNPMARLRLLCLPYAGGGTQVFRGWEPSLPSEVEVLAVRLPGRENRLREAPYVDLHALADALLAGIPEILDRPYAIVGHSMGALLGFELVRRLRQAGARLPVHLIASGYRAPHQPYPLPAIRGLPRDAFLEGVRRYNGIPASALESPELLDLMMPALRADFSVCETYRYSEGPPLACPISAYGGLADPDVQRGDLEAWGLHTTSGHVVRMFPGDHFFLQSCRDQFLEALTRDVWAHVAAGAS